VTEKRRFTTTELVSILEYLDRKLVAFKNGATTSKQMAKLMPLPAYVNQLAYYETAVAVVNKMRSDCQCELAAAARRENAIA
jgi:hypothetical protein